MKLTLLRTSPFVVIEKIAGNCRKIAEKLFPGDSAIATSSGPNETSKACMHGSRLFRYVRVNYDPRPKLQLY